MGSSPQNLEQKVHEAWKIHEISKAVFNKDVGITPDFSGNEKIELNGNPQEQPGAEIIRSFSGKGSPVFDQF
jgi:hypothetical protein